MAREKKNAWFIILNSIPLRTYFLVRNSWFVVRFVQFGLKIFFLFSIVFVAIGNVFFSFCNAWHVFVHTVCKLLQLCQPNNKQLFFSLAFISMDSVFTANEMEKCLPLHMRFFFGPIILFVASIVLLLDSSIEMHIFYYNKGLGMCAMHIL